MSRDRSFAIALYWNAFNQAHLMRFVPHDCLYFKRKRSQKVDHATFCTEWESALSLFSTRRNFVREAGFFSVLLSLVLHENAQAMKNSAPRAKLVENRPLSVRFRAKLIWAKQGKFRSDAKFRLVENRLYDTVEEENNCLNAPEIYVLCCAACMVKSGSRRCIHAEWITYLYSFSMG